MEVPNRHFETLSFRNKLYGPSFPNNLLVTTIFGKPLCAVLIVKDRQDVKREVLIFES